MICWSRRPLNYLRFKPVLDFRPFNEFGARRSHSNRFDLIQLYPGGLRCVIRFSVASK
jgi:hypothetical protein